MGGSHSNVTVFSVQYLRSAFHNLDNGCLLITILIHNKAFEKLDHSRFKKTIDSIAFDNQLYDIRHRGAKYSNHGHGS